MTNALDPKYQLLSYIGEQGFSGHALHAASIKEALERLCIDSIGSVNTNAIRSLVRNKYIDSTRLDGMCKVTLTPAGAHKLQDYQLLSLHVTVPKSWDHKWRVITYDIPASKKSERYRFTTQLKKMGFTSIQSSLWVHPYECRLVIDALGTALGLNKYIKYMVVESFSEDTEKRLQKAYGIVRL